MKYAVRISILLASLVHAEQRDKLYGHLVVKDQALTKNLTVCNDTILNNLEIQGAFDICGVPACELAQAYALLFTATSADIPHTLVLRDSAGDFAASVITVTGSIRFLAQDGNTLTLATNPATQAYTFQLPSNTGLSHYVLTTDGTGATRWQPVSVTGGLADLNSLVASTQYFATGTAGTSFTIMSLATTHTFNIPLAETSGVTGGVISNTDYTNFNNTYTTIQAATPLDIPNTLVLRDNTGTWCETHCFAATHIIASDVILNTVTLQPSPTTGSYTFQLPPNSGAQEYVLTTNGTGVTSWQPISAEEAITDLNTLTTSTQFFANGYAGIQPAFNSAINTHTLNIPLASTYGVLAGLITSTDYYHFQNTYTTLNQYVITIVGDTGSVSGTAVSLKANATAGYSVTFTGSNTKMVLNVSNSAGNTFIGNSAGYTSTSEGGNVALGYEASTNANGEGCVALGFKAPINNRSVAIGCNSQVLGVYAIGIGFAATSGGLTAAIGAQASSGGGSSNAVGYAASSAGANSVALGYEASSVGAQSIALGAQALAAQTNAIAIGNQAAALAPSSIMLGGISNTVTGTQATVINGNTNTASGFNSYALGQYASATNNYSFVYSDSAVSPYSSHAPNSFNIRAGGGAYFDANITTTGNVVFVANGNTLTLQPNSLTTTYTFQLPPNSGTTNYVLTTDGTGNTSWQAYASGITTITGDVGSVAGSAVSLTANTTAGYSVTFTGANTKMVLNVTNKFNNTFIGEQAGNSSTTPGNVVLGYQACAVLTNDGDNLVVGFKTANTASGFSEGVLVGASIASPGLNTGMTAVGYGVGNTNGGVAVGSGTSDEHQGAASLAFGYAAVANNNSDGATTIGAKASGGTAKNIIIGYSLSSFSSNPVTRIGNSYIVDGVNSMFVGQNAGNLVYTGTGNIGIGQAALASVTTGTCNTVIGVQSGQRMTTGSGNTLAGQFAAQALITGAGNVVIGQDAAISFTSGSSNTIIGTQAGSAYTNAESSNIIIGRGVTGVTGETGYTRISNNLLIDSGLDLFIGQNASNISYSTSGYYDVGIGANVFPNLFRGACTCVGVNAGNSLNSAQYITFLGYNTAPHVSSPGAYTMIGANAGSTLAGSSNNIAIIGANVQGITLETEVVRIGNNYISDGTNSMFIGQHAGNLVYTGTGNIGIGQAALAKLTTGTRNTVIGVQAGQTITSGAGNTLVGQLAGSAYTSSESNNIIIGQNVIGTTGENNVLRVGAAQTSCYVTGINGATSSGGTAVLVNSSNQLGTTTSSEKFKENIDTMSEYSGALMNLRPVTFNYKVSPDVLSSGLIAEEVAKIMPQLVYYDAEGLPYTVQYHDLPALLLNELQKTYNQIQMLQHKSHALQQRICTLE